jgi:AraC-like DNA-binding protein
MLPDYLEAAEIEPEPVFRQAGMCATDVQTPTIVRRSQIHHVLSIAARRVGSPEIALALGSLANPAMLGSIGQAMAAGPDIGSCMRAQRALMPSFQSQVGIGLREEGEEAVWSHRLIGDDEGAWLLHEGAVAFNVHMLRQMAGEDWAPERIVFPHACKGRRAIYEKHFQAPVTFGGEGEARIHMKRTLLSRRPRLPGARQHSDRSEGDESGLLAGFEPDSSAVERAVTRMVEGALPHRPLRLATAARILGFSPRTMQRRLEDGGTAFELIVDARRHSLALKWLTETETSVTDVAMRLGYSDSAHFNRAFRRWEGFAPGDFRRRNG